MPLHSSSFLPAAWSHLTTVNHTWNNQTLAQHFRAHLDETCCFHWWSRYRKRVASPVRPASVIQHSRRFPLEFCTSALQYPCVPWIVWWHSLRALFCPYKTLCFYKRCCVHARGELTHWGLNLACELVLETSGGMSLCELVKFKPLSWAYTPVVIQKLFEVIISVIQIGHAHWLIMTETNFGRIVFIFFACHIRTW